MHKLRRSDAAAAPLRAAILVIALALLAGCGGSGAGGGPAAAPAQSTSTPSGAVPNAQGQMQEETYQGCPPQGDDGDTQLNLRKNRIDTAGSYETRSVADMLALTWPQSVERARRDSWSSSDAAAVARDEGQAVQVEGYVLNIRHEGPESPNCHDQSARDYHMWIGAAPSSDPTARADSFIAELTPRVVALNPNWGSESTLLRLKGQHVRISGWTLLDQEHPEQLHKTRGTLWEIHPITRVEVEQQGQWTDLASGQVSLGAGSVGSSGSSSDGSSHRSSHRSGRHRSYSS